jgi:hypothetical protein
MRKRGKMERKAGGESTGGGKEDAPPYSGGT